MRLCMMRDCIVYGTDENAISVGIYSSIRSSVIEWMAATIVGIDLVTLIQNSAVLDANIQLDLQSPVVSLMVYQYFVMFNSPVA